MSTKTIGLCLSGGGHRASIFSLGALLYLVDANRHCDIEEISSVSGGSLTSAFLAVQPKPLREMDPAEFDACAATWARQIAGSPAWWYTAFAAQALLFIAWVLLVCVGWGWLTPLARFITLTPSWWEIQVVYWAAVCAWALIVGSRPGGTFWRWWGTWLYLGIVLPALFLVIFVWWSPLSWKWRLLIGILAACVLALRTRVADLAFRATVCRDLHLRDIPAAPRYIFCATEMETGRHAYFARDFIYSWGAGLGQPADLPLSTAVQVSANFPVAFPYRILGRKKYDFHLAQDYRYLPLVLSDGGVQDNTGVGWFLEAVERTARLRRFLRLSKSLDPKVFGSLSLTEPVCQSIERQLAAMEDCPDLLLVVNSSFPQNWSRTRFRSIPVLGELEALVRVQGAMYDHRARQQSRELHRLFFEGSRAGAMVSIEQNPNAIYGLFTNQGRDRYTVKEQLDNLGLSDLPEALVERYSQRARDARDRDVFGPDYKTEFVRVAERSRELEERLQQLQEQKAQAPRHSVEEARLDTEIDKCKTEKWHVDQTVPNRELEGLSRRIDESTQQYKETESSWLVPTTFRPLGVSATSELLRHGYLNCMNMSSFLLEGFPRFGDPPTTEELQQLARGIPRKRYPTWPKSAAATA